MRYQSLKAFEKHLADSSPRHLCKCYLIQVADSGERAKVMSLLLRYCLAPEGQLLRMEGDEANLPQLFDALQSRSLFGGETVVVLDLCDKLGKKEAEGLGEFLEKGSLAGSLMLGASGKTVLAKAVEKLGVILDLSEEKPWDRDKRIGEGLQARAQSAGKRLGVGVVPLLFERLGNEVVLLDSEIDKLICYTGERLMIECADVLQISSASKMYSLWQMAEDLVWGEGTMVESEAFHGLIPSVRAQLQLGLKLATFLAEGTAIQCGAPHFPKMWPKLLEKRKEQAAQKGMVFFQRGLDLLFKVELLSRTGSSQVEALFDLFRTGLYAKR